MVIPVMQSLVSVGMLLLLARETWCQPDAYLYFADYVRGTVYKMDLSLGQNARRIRLITQNLPEPLRLDVDPYTENVYVANIYVDHHNTTKYIKKYHFNSGNTATFPLAYSAGIWGFAVDPISQLVFYADYIHEMIIAVTTDFRYHTVIIDKGLVAPRGIALDPVNKVIYWADSSKSNPQISKANMDGTNKQIIVYHGLSLPVSMTLDPYDRKLYWVDWELRTIERCDTNGNNRERFLTLTSAVIDLAADEIYLYFTQRYKGPVYRVRKLGSRNKESIGERLADNATAYFSLAYVKKSPPPKVTNQCSGSSRGGCAHICIPTTQSRVCQCSVGYILQPDGTSCSKSPFRRGLVASDVNRRALVLLDLDTNITKTLTLGGSYWHDTPRGVAVDEDTNEVFWVDGQRKTISKACINTPCYSQLRVLHEEESELSALAIDSQRKQLYSVDTGLQRIIRISYSGLQQEILVQGVTGFTTLLTLDIGNRMMYWANSEMIERSSMDGEGRSTFLRTGFQLSGLVFDGYGNRLFALHFENSQVVEYSVTGTTEQILYKPEKSVRLSYYGLALSNGNLYFSHRDEQLLYEMNINTKVLKEYGRPRFNRVVGIAYFGPGDRTSEEHTTPASTTTANTQMAGGKEKHPATPSDGKNLNHTLIIAVSVSVAGLLIIALIIICGLVIYKRIMASVGSPSIPSVAPQDPQLKPSEEKPNDSVYNEPYEGKRGNLPAATAPHPVLPLSAQPPIGGMNKLETKLRRPPPLPTENKPPPRPPLRIPSPTRDDSYLDMRGGSGDLSAAVQPDVLLPLNMMRS